MESNVYFHTGMGIMLMPYDVFPYQWNWWRYFPAEEVWRVSHMPWPLSRDERED